ncbi:MAG TPA: head maturation protease, ClpP-related, partial [Phycisphaerae bacterium]|nr:head maturation protease, ClpP-related [Phycisphaerae bacterium]
MPEHRGQGSGVRGQGSKAFSFRCEAGRAEILLYDAIDPWYGISAKQFHDELKALGPLSHIDLRINSPGGSITEGMAIHSILKRQTAKITAHIDGIAASMASIVAMAAGEIVMAQGAYLMIHNPLGYVVGEADDMRDLADLLDKMKQQLVNIYAARTRRPADEIAALMDTETWLTADEAIAGGFADRASPELALAAALDPQRFFNPPKNLCKEPVMADPVTPPALPPAASLSDLKAACPGADNDFYIAQLGNCATLEQSRAAWSARQTAKLDELTVRNETLGGEVTALKAELAALKAKPGVAPVGGKPADDGAADADPLA